MKDGGRTDEYAPDSSLDAVEPGKYFIIGDGQYSLIHINDFVDCDEDALDLDPIWGSSFQIADFEGNNLIIRKYNASTDLYELIAISPKIISNCYVKMPHVTEVPEGGILGEVL